MKRVLGGVLIVAFVILLTLCAYLAYYKFSVGSVSSREKMVAATVWELQREGYSEKDVTSIKITYNPVKMKGAPYEALVAFKSDKSRYVTYGWKNKQKTEVEKTGWENR